MRPGQLMGSSANSLYLPSPTGIPNCQLWIDANDPSGNGSQPADGQALTTWVDKSAQGRNLTQGTAANRPTFKTNIQNSRPALLFDGVNDWLGGTPIVSTTLSMYLAYRPITLLPAFLGLIVCNGFGNANGMGYGTFNTGNRTILQGGAALYEDSAAVAQWEIARVTFNAATGFYDLYINGVNTLHTSGGQGTPGSNFTVGALAITTNPYNGYIGEVICYNSILSTSQAASVENYLLQKWGLT